MKQYLDLLQKVAEEGQWSDNRTGIRTKGIFGAMIQHDLAEGFPLLTTKKMAWNQIKGELLAFISGTTDVREFRKRGCTVWDANLDADWWKEKRDDEFDLGLIYGSRWRAWESYNNLCPPARPLPKLREGLERTYLGVANGKGKEGSIVAKVWEGMIDRCYNTNSPSYPDYGACNVYVCDRWLEFKAFEEDVKLIPNWNLKEQDPRGYVLDKDELGTGYCYSLESCQWITPSENSNLKSTKIYTVEKNGRKFTFENPTAFCEQHRIDNRNFSDLWTGNKNAKKRSGYTLVSIRDKPTGYVDQLQNLIDDIKKNPTSRRLIVTAWDPNTLDRACLPPCHVMFQVKVRDGRLDLCWFQRSCDLFLGVPFNLASYALLTHILASITGYEPGVVTGFLGDVHIYENHLDQVDEQLSRTELQLPTISVGKINSINLVDNATIDLVNYVSHPAIKAEMAV